MTVALDFGRTRRTRSFGVAPLNAVLQHELVAAAAGEFTGSIDVVDRATGSMARLFLYVGGVYSIDLFGYTPPVGARLLTAATGDTERADQREEMGDLPLSGPRVGPMAVARGWLGVEDLARINQEFLLASLGAVLACDKVSTTRLDGDVTADYCTVPVPIDAVIDAVRMRAGRLRGGWSMLGGSFGEPSASVVLASTGDPVPPELTLGEFRAVAAQVDGSRCLDAIAERLGLTRAEAVHIASLLVDARVLRVAEVVASVPTDRLLVPEAFGTVKIQPVAHLRLRDPVPVPESEPEVDLSAAPAVEDVSSLIEQLQAAVSQERAATARVHAIQERLLRARAETGGLENEPGISL